GVIRLDCSRNLHRIRRHHHGIGCIHVVGVRSSCERHCNKSRSHDSCQHRFPVVLSVSLAHVNLLLHFLLTVNSAIVKRKFPCKLCARNSTRLVFCPTASRASAAKS